MPTPAVRSAGKTLPSVACRQRQLRRSTLLEALLTSEELATWTRTRRGGQLSTRKAELRRAAHYPPIAALATISTIDKQLTAFGPTLSAKVSPVTGRIHANYSVAGASSGRATCSGPNLQQIPRDKRFRALFVAAPGNILIAADFSSMELRAAAHISGDRAMTEAFERGDDLHRITAADMTEQGARRCHRRRTRGCQAGQFRRRIREGAAGLVKSAWDAYRTVMYKGRGRCAGCAASPKPSRLLHAGVTNTASFVRNGERSSSARMQPKASVVSITFPGCRERALPTRALAICRYRAPAPTRRCWRWRQSTTACSSRHRWRPGRMVARSRSSLRFR